MDNLATLLGMANGFTVLNGPSLATVSGPVPRITSLLIKPASAVCNLDCAYCFYLDREADPVKDPRGAVGDVADHADHDEIEAVVDLELIENIREMGFYRLFADKDAFADLLLAQPARGAPAARQPSTWNFGASAQSPSRS